jgi:predicted nucleotidyltransferase
MEQITHGIHKDPLRLFPAEGSLKDLLVQRADFRPDSDVDVRVEFGPDARVGLLAMCRMQRELADLFHHPFDLVPKDGLKPRIREAVLASTEVLYAG